jgi:hypothetical protein
VGEQGQDPQHNLAFMQSTMLAQVSAVVDAFANESHKTRSFDDINQDKMAALEATIRAIEGVHLYDSTGHRNVSSC